MWEEVIDCLRVMGKTTQAEATVRKQLQENPTPLLWCVLGDICFEDEYYLKAWELSGQRYARAQRALAQSCVRRQEVSPF